MGIEQGGLLDGGAIERREKIGNFLGDAIKNGHDHFSVREHFDTLRYAEEMMKLAPTFSDEAAEHPHRPEELLPEFEGALERAEAAKQAAEELAKQVAFSKKVREYLDEAA